MDQNTTVSDADVSRVAGTVIELFPSLTDVRTVPEIEATARGMIAELGLTKSEALLAVVRDRMSPADALCKLRDIFPAIAAEQDAA